MTMAIAMAMARLDSQASHCRPCPRATLGAPAVCHRHPQALPLVEPKAVVAISVPWSCAWHITTEMTMAVPIVVAMAMAMAVTTAMPVAKTGHDLGLGPGLVPGPLQYFLFV